MLGCMFANTMDYSFNYVHVNLTIMNCEYFLSSKSIEKQT